MIKQAKKKMEITAEEEAAHRRAEHCYLCEELLGADKVGAFLL
jgi:hypothetical protein